MERCPACGGVKPPRSAPGMTWPVWWSHFWRRKFRSRLPDWLVHRPHYERIDERAEAAKRAEHG